MQVVRPGFGKVLPGVGAGVGAHIPLAPIRLWPVGIVCLQGRGVVASLVAEHRLEGTMPDAVPDQAVPVVVAGLMAEVTEDRPVGLCDALPMALPRCVDGLGNVDCDQT